MAKEPYLIIVEGTAEEKIFNFLQYDFSNPPLLPNHIALTVKKSGGRQSPAKRILEKAKQEKRSKGNAPYRHIFALLDSDRAFPGMAAEFQKEEIILMTCTPRLENVLLACDGQMIKPNKKTAKDPKKEAKEAKEAFKTHFGTPAQNLNWWSNPLPCGLTKNGLLNCPLLKPFWEKILP